MPAANALHTASIATRERVFRRRVVAMLFVAALALHLGRALHGGPPSTDEMLIGLIADSLATTWRDMVGRFMPLYFPVGEFGRDMWFQPLLVYTTSLVLKVLPFSEMAVRVPMAIAGAIDVALIYLAASLLFESVATGVMAAILLMVSPAHLLHASVATDFQAPVTFALAWFVCLLMYDRTRRIAWLLPAALSLGLGLYSHVSAWFVMPVCALMTCGVVYVRRERAKGYALVAAGFVPAALCVVAFLATHAEMRSHLSTHYQNDLPRSATGTFIGTFASGAEVAEMAPRFAGFFSPRFLFLNGPQFSPWTIGVFVLPVAGLIAAGVVRIVRRLSVATAMIAVMFVLAPLPASGLGEPEAIRRALTLIPFGVLLAVAGLEHLRRAESDIERRLTMVLIWTAPMVLVIADRVHLFRSQAFVRALTVPLSVTGLAALIAPIDFSRQRRLLVTTAVVVLVIVIAVNALVGPRGVIVGASIAVGLLSAVGLRTSDSPILARRGPLVVALLAALASEFTFFYFDLTLVPRIRHVPPSVLRFAAALFALCSMGVTAVLATGVVRRYASGSPSALATIVSLILVGYFYVDGFGEFRLRWMLLAAILSALVWSAICSGELVRSHRGPWFVTVTGVLAVSAIQLGYVYPSSVVVRPDQAGAAAARAWDVVVARMDAQDVPMICLAQGNVNETLYARFYLVKHRHKEALARLVPDCADLPRADRVRALPRGSLVIAIPSASAERTVSDLIASGVIAQQDLITTPEGTPMYWILQRA